MIYLASPELRVTGTISAIGGPGGSAPGSMSVGGPPRTAVGGDGGMGRIRVSVDPATCDEGGTWRMEFHCAANTEPTDEEAYVGVYPE